jgi:GSH-dependent disulfide-bond oxidoreductase
MIDLYTWTTPNGRKASIALEELGLPYKVLPIDIMKDEQFQPQFLRVSPNNRIPAIVDRESGISLMESGAILIYLSDKTGRFMPKEGEPRYRVMEWLMWQMGSGPMLAQVLDRRLAEHQFVADDYSIADIAIWPWISQFEWQTIDLNAYPNVKRWYTSIAKRPAVQRGYKVPKDVDEIPMP